ncbi:MULTISPECIES: 3-phosphoshikimate 1-carboxyvinyltransferase [unclassified Pseudomonas]|uniref:3-phosphoshikimate 1-carboxyvinyltransferase n=1 Tax=unclassified Pseudomonas TaxID=196821 RepID=UPI000BD8A8D5|nr:MULTISPECIES: 3-phosphoshikimate 1-carboxyvinyltransferase [unclassified Pseudomonas]PVZ20267.1 3-phosphoshikimate 1-carboxyvinyltransferase [Pseudomonas sp. URIL14HWK12:I12]PVZ27333.1 3-phosphoshikimate 1-carboxyvinyltransferase [Pseudomonas sp. URIL14HWK12:I10]PVZ38222.1 3-phosphoshikimate 1-carboxyvinyltransferase [Pseudomonas sp. URIL14HWK12:I11]SNZ04196.1 3-phosphoshikimate 1-carboxyvinyltransferase [Pseudomonas sp. URIL14HWK12:I9]
MTAPATVTVTPPGRALEGRVAPPGSKSITNRALLLAALAKGTSRLTGALKSDDTRHMSNALRQMGVTVEEPDATTFVVSSSGRLLAPAEPLFLGNAGTAVRFLTAAVATVAGEVVLDGDHYMQKRPIGPLLDALRAGGVDASSATGCPPVTVRGNGQLAVERFEIDGGLSSQYVSALLMLAACGQAPIDVALTGKDIGARGYVDLTVAAMQAFGAQVQMIDEVTWRVQPTGYQATDYQIEPDASAATYLWAAQALTGGRIDLGVANEAFTQPDARAQQFIAQFPHMAPVIDGSQMQDAIPTLAVLAAFNETPVRFTQLANLRVKECDRVQALHHGLNAIRPGLARVEGDDLIVEADSALAGTEVTARIDTHSDHRMAMCFALAGLKIAGIAIEDPLCVGKTYPEYWRELEALGVRCTFQPAP